MKHLTYVTLCCLMCLLSACGSGFPHALNDTRGPAVACPPERIPIRFGVHEGQLPVYAPLAAAFNAQVSDMCVTVVPFGGSGPPVAGITEGIIDTVREADVVELFRHELNDQTEPLFLDLRPLLEADASFNHANYFPNALQLIGPEQQLYMLPRTLEFQVIAYNQDLWNARGLPTPDATWTWEQVLDAATTLATRDGLTTTVYGLHDINAGLTTALFSLDVQNVPFASLPEADVDLTQPIYHTTVDQVAALAEAGVLYLDDRDQDILRQKIRAGQIAMWWYWTDMITTELEQEEPLPFPVGVIPMPALDSYLQQQGSGYLINRATLYPTQAWRWVAFLSQQAVPPIGGLWQATEYPPRRSLVAQPGIEEQHPPAMQTALAGMAERPRQPVPAGHDSYPQLDSLARALEQVVLDGVAVAPALQAAQANLQQQVADLRQTPTVLVEAVPVNTPVVLNVPPGGTVITFATLTRDDPRWQPVIDRFQAAHPTLVIQLIHASPGASNSDLAAQADCFVTTDTDTSAVFPSLRDLHPLLEADPTFAPEDYLPGLLTPRADQRLYVLPYEIGLQPLIYQPQRFDQAGLAAPTAAWTLADLLAAATHLTQPAQQQYGFAASLPLLHVDALLAQAGASRTSGAGDDRFPTFTAPATVSALQPYITLLRDAGPPLPADPAMASMAVEEAIRQGQVALWLDPGAQVFPIMPTQQQYGFPIALAPPPFPQAVTVRQGLAIAAQTRHPEACWQWIADLSREPLLIQGDWPARASLAASAVVQQQATPGALAVYTAYQQAQVRLPVPAPDSFGETPLTMDWFNQAIQQAIRGAELEPALAVAQRMTERQVRCVQAGGTAAACGRQGDPAAPTPAP